MSTDWNWFFTSVSQSAAALVGIFGAFIVTKILTNQTAFSGNKVKAQELISEGKRIIDVASHIRFDWYHQERLKEVGYLLHQELERGQRPTADEFYSQVKLPFAPKETVINYLEYQRTHWLKQNKYVISGTASQMLHLELSNTVIQNALTDERKDMDEIFTEALHLTRVVSNFHTTISLNPESSAAITSSLKFVFGLFVVGVIYPLSFLPVPLNWKPALTIVGIPEFWFSFRGGIAPAHFRDVHLHALDVLSDEQRNEVPARVVTGARAV